MNVMNAKNIINLIKRIIFSKKVNMGMINAVNMGAKHVEVFSVGSRVKFQGYFLVTKRVGFLEVGLKQLLNHLKNNTQMIFKDARINFYEGDDEVRIYFPIPKELLETDGEDLIVVKKSDLVKALNQART